MAYQALDEQTVVNYLENCQAMERAFAKGTCLTGPCPLRDGDVVSLG